MAIRCRKCDRSAIEDGAALIRVNPKGEKGIWECTPDCGVPFMSDEGKLLHVLKRLEERDDDSICDICSAELPADEVYTCSRCGLAVCPEHYAPAEDVCVDCEDPHAS